MQIGEWLNDQREKFIAEHGELPSYNLMLVSNDWILPDHLTLLQLQVIRDAEGRLYFPGFPSEPEHGLTVWERGWYEKNRHIYPQSKWRVFETHV